MKRSPEDRAAIEAARQQKRAATEAAKQQRRERREQLAVLDALRIPNHEGTRDPSTVDIGSIAEERAIDHLRVRDYEILERNYRCKAGEIDIVAADADVLVFVEVKSRADDDCADAVESVGRRKRAMVTRAAQVYLEHRRPDFDEFRFDVVAINGDEIDLYQDAWRGGLL